MKLISFILFLCGSRSSFHKIKALGIVWSFTEMLYGIIKCSVWQNSNSNNFLVFPLFLYIAPGLAVCIWAYSVTIFSLIGNDQVKTFLFDSKIIQKNIFFHKMLNILFCKTIISARPYHKVIIQSRYNLVDWLTSCCFLKRLHVVIRNYKA